MQFTRCWPRPYSIESALVESSKLKDKVHLVNETDTSSLTKSHWVVLPKLNHLHKQGQPARSHKWFSHQHQTQMALQSKDHVNEAVMALSPSWNTNYHHQQSSNNWAWSMFKLFSNEIVSIFQHYTSMMAQVRTYFPIIISEIST